MKTPLTKLCLRSLVSISRALWLSLAVAALFPLLAAGQGSMGFNNNVFGVIVTRVYGPDPLNPSVATHGNTEADTPAGTQVYNGAALTGSGWRAQLWSAPGADQAESALQPATPITTFRTGAAAGK